MIHPTFLNRSLYWPEGRSRKGSIVPSPKCLSSGQEHPKKMPPGKMHGDFLKPIPNFILEDKDISGRRECYVIHELHTLISTTLHGQSCRLHATKTWSLDVDNYVNCFQLFWFQYFTFSYFHLVVRACWIQLRYQLSRNQSPVLFYFQSQINFLHPHSIWYQSRYFSMDTPGKTNIEFRNKVNETLVRHETSFDQFNAALQTILTEL